MNILKVSKKLYRWIQKGEFKKVK